MIEAVKENRLLEAFGAGTAVIVSPIQSFCYRDEVYRVPIQEDKGAGPLTQKIMQMLMDIQYGRVNKPNWQVEVCRI